MAEIHNSFQILTTIKLIELYVNMVFCSRIWKIFVRTILLLTAHILHTDFVNTTILDDNKMIGGFYSTQQCCHYVIFLNKKNVFIFRNFSFFFLLFCLLNHVFTEFEFNYGKIMVVTIHPKIAIRVHSHHNKLKAKPKNK